MARVSRRAFLASGLGVWALSQSQRLWAADEAFDSAFRFQNPRRFEVVHQASFSNGEVALDSLELWIPLPVEDSRQEVRSLRIQPNVPTSRDVNGLATIARLYRTRGLPRRGEALTLEVAASLVLREVMPDWRVIEQAFALPYPQDRQFRLYTRAEKKVESKHPAIVEQAQQFQAEAQTPLAIARAAYDWVRRRTVYQRNDEFAGALACLQSGQGECGEFSALFVALCRAAGVPARMISGCWADETNGWHCWAEVLLPTGQWLPVDATLGQQGRGNAEFYFGSQDNRRVALCLTNDVDFGNARGSHRQRESLQMGACWWQGRHLKEPPKLPEIRFQVSGQEVDVAGQ